MHLDERPVGGHTSDHAPRALLIDVVDRMLDGRPVDAARYQDDPTFAGTTTPVPWSHRIRDRLRLRSRLRALLARGAG